MYADSHLLFVHIKPSAALIHAFHLSLPLDRQRRVARGSPRSQRFCLTFAWQQFGVPWAPQPFSRRTRGTRTWTASVGRRHGVSPISSVEGDAHGVMSSPATPPTPSPRRATRRQHGP